VHIDLSLHTSMLTRLLQEEQVQVERSTVIEDSGLMALYQIWLKIIAEALVQQSRFDPLHTAKTEQTLQNKMPHWLATAATNETVLIEVEYGGVTHQAEIESLELIAAASPVYQNIISNLRALIRAEETPAVQLSDRAARMPGLAEILKSRVGAEIFLLEPGAAGRGLINRCREGHASSGIKLTRQLHWDQSPIVVEQKVGGGAGSRPTHILFGHNAHCLNGAPMVLGSQTADGERYLDLQLDMPGVSRRHCVLSSADGQHVVTDHSRYGTFLNGHRIDGSAVLQTGDLIRIGTPGFEFRLIRVEDNHGS
jgi:hypothetical protein